MRKKWSLLFYVLMMGVFGYFIYRIIDFGNELQKTGTTPATAPATPTATPGSLETFVNSLQSAIHLPLAILLLQIMVIIITIRIFGWLFNKIGQPAVVGEIVAGIVLGPSVLGLFMPDVSHFLFPQGSMGNLNFLSQVGLILFMFVIGLELDLSLIRKQARDAVIISHASIVIPYTLGMGLALVLFKEFAPPHVPFLHFALFMGIAMSITAFPVLARIIQERGITKTKLGAMAITCAAADDVTAWCILALLIAVVKAGSSGSVLFTIALVGAYVALMWFVVRPLLRRLYAVYTRNGAISKTMMAIVFMMLLLSAYVTELIGIHALFGAFMAGVVMPPEFNFRKLIIDKIEDISLVLLLPLFFAMTGLRTQIGLLNSGHLWLVCLAIIAVAVIGKFGGSMLAAKVVGQTWRESISIGALMNTRGLMELVVLNIGYDLGILTPAVFAMMVLMALLTTFMTNPVLNAMEYFNKVESKSSLRVVG